MLTNKPTHLSGFFSIRVVSTSLYLHSPWPSQPSTPRNSPAGLIFSAFPTTTAACAASPNYPAATPRCGVWRPAPPRGRSIPAAAHLAARVGRRLALSKPLAASMSSSSPLSIMHLAVSASSIFSRYTTSFSITLTVRTCAFFCCSSESCKSRVANWP